jgi:hypothetical protein
LELTCTINLNEVCAEALIAFDNEFTGESIRNVWVLDENALPNDTLGAVVGPSGNGKSTSYPSECDYRSGRIVKAYLFENSLAVRAFAFGILRALRSFATQPGP